MRPCCNTPDDQPHFPGCVYAIGNVLNRPCAKHSVRGCPACLKDAESARSPTASPSTPAPARDPAPYRAWHNSVIDNRSSAQVAHAIVAHGVSAQQIADGLNMLHAVRAGTAGKGAAAPLVDFDEQLRIVDACRGIAPIRTVIKALRQQVGDDRVPGDLLPVPMVLHCPRCGLQHVDAPEAGWDNPPHKSHLCRPGDGGCGCIWRPAEVSTVGVPALTATGDADNWFPGSATSLGARLAVWDVVAAVRDDFTDAAACAALDEAVRRVQAFPGSGLPEQSRAPADLGEWVTSRRFPEHGVLRVISFTFGADGFCEVTAMSDGPPIGKVVGPFWDFQRAEAPPTRYAWDSEPPEIPTMVRRVRGFREHDLAGILDPFDEIQAQLDSPSDGPFTAGECDLPTAGCCTLSGGAVFDREGAPFCFVSIDDVVGGQVRHAVDRCEEIAAALNAVDEMTCPYCHDLGHSHEPDCPLRPVE